MEMELGQVHAITGFGTSSLEPLGSATSVSYILLTQDSNPHVGIT